ncbi:MAG: ribonuclease D [Proteobacteria bacterium]|nr:ribonuclease D [Pseudomonadota bacterium]NCA27883.1 ribonuclease D [Pseudomonadota bacterium]
MKFTIKKIHEIDFDFCLIEDLASLKNFVQLISDDDVVALDTEFTRRSTYYPILSTIQIALKKPNNKKILALIDVIKCPVIEDIIFVLNHPKIIKILHASSQDLQIFYRISNSVAQNIFDTQIMANFCQEMTNMGYSNLVKKVVNVEICKKMQSSDWQLRPLSTAQIDYALIDVIFLHEIYDFFTKKLFQNQSFEWFCEEMKDFIKKTLSDNSKNLIYSFNLARLSHKQISQLNKLVIIREKFAQIYDLPREHLISNKNLEFIAFNFPNINFANYKLPHDFTDEVMKSLALEVDNYQINIPKKLSADDKNSIAKIKSLVAKTAKKYGLNEQFLLNNNQIKNIVTANNIEQIKYLISHWRFNLLGNDINQILIKNYENNRRKLENELRL